VAGIRLHDLPDAAQAAWSALRHRLVEILGDDLVAMWAHGGTTSVADPARGGDLDTYVVVARPPDETTAGLIEHAHDAIAGEHGIDWDGWYILADDARRSDPPRHAWLPDRRDTSWAIHRAHWFAGRFVRLHGALPGDVVPIPTWEELIGELDRELEHIERHVFEGDTDPFEATYALLTGSRILHSLETRVVGVSKHAAGTWALERLPDRWHASLHAALRSYHGHETDADAGLLAAEVAPFVAFVREQLPPTWDRPADAPPRWSGS